MQENIAQSWIILGIFFYIVLFCRQLMEVNLKPDSATAIRHRQSPLSQLSPIYQRLGQAHELLVYRKKELMWQNGTNMPSSRHARDYDAFSFSLKFLSHFQTLPDSEWMSCLSVVRGSRKKFIVIGCVIVLNLINTLGLMNSRTICKL